MKVKKLIIWIVVSIFLVSIAYAGILGTTKIINPSGWEFNGSIIQTLTNNLVVVSGNITADNFIDKDFDTMIFDIRSSTKSKVIYNISDADETSVKLFIENGERKTFLTGVAR